MRSQATNDESDRAIFTMENFEVVIVGAGLQGLIFAKTYLEIHRDASIVLLDSQQSLGGVWAEERIYPGLKTNHCWRAYEFSDFPMDDYNLKPDQHIPGSTMYQYLCDFAAHYDITKHIRLETYVSKAVYKGVDGWQLHIRKDEKDSIIQATFLVVATGISSQTNMPNLEGVESFDRPLFHTKDYGRRAEEVEGVKTVAVLGGAKSAMDVAHHNASRGAKVHWIIRRSGSGPKWLSQLRATPLKIRTDKLVNARALSWVSPCIWANDGYDGVRNFLQRTWLGQKFVGKFIKDMQKGILQGTGYNRSDLTKQLIPPNHLFWHGAQIAAHNFDSDILALVDSGAIQVHMADIDSLSEGTIHLSNGTELEVDVLLCATGWQYKPNLSFEGVSDDELGLPLNQPLHAAQFAQADAIIERRLPFFAHHPAAIAHPPRSPTALPVEPFRQVRFAVPPQLMTTHNIAFLGTIGTVATSAMSQVISIWVTAYFHSQIPAFVAPDDAVERSAWLKHIQDEVILYAQFMKRRTILGAGPVHADMSQDTVPFLDVLFRDLGMNPWRKPSRWKEMFEGYTPADYKGLVQEWLSLQSQSVKGS